MQSKTKTTIVSRPCTMHPQSPPLTIGRTMMKESDDLGIDLRVVRLLHQKESDDRDL